MSRAGTVFWWWWGVAALAHVLGNRRWGEIVPSPTLLGVLTLALLLAALWVVARPGDRPARIALGALVPIVALAETPVLSNHMWLAAAVSVAALAALPGRSGWYARFAPVGRLTLLAFYGFAAFAKVNTGFLDPSASCAVFYADQAFGTLGLPLPSSTPVAPVLPWVALLVEASVPVLLLLRRTRVAGVALASTFHIVLSLDPGQHFYDFTAVLLPLFLLFLDEASLERLADRYMDARRGPGRLVAPMAVVVTAALGLLTLGPATQGTVVVLQFLPFVVWVPLVAVHLFALARSAPVGVGRIVGDRRLPVWAGLVVAVVVANGVLPYLEVKRVADFTMYANLRIADGETNHLIVRRSFPVATANAEPYVVVAANDPVFEPYVGSGWALPERSVAAAVPDGDVRLARLTEGGRVPADAPPPLTGPSVWFNRLFPLRAIDTTEPTRCQTYFLPAH